MKCNEVRNEIDQLLFGEKTTLSSLAEAHLLGCPSCLNYYEATIQTTEMWDPWDLAHEMHSNTFDHPETYSFVDISQHNHNSGQEHWDNAQTQRTRVIESGVIRPLNNVKVYGAETSRFGSERDGIERFWRNIIGGMASTGFHRPTSGIGLGPVAETHLRSARMFVNQFDIFNAEPDLDLLSDRDDNEAYATKTSSDNVAIFFPAASV